MKIHGYLTAVEIDRSVTSAVHFLEQKGAGEKDILAFRLTLEEVLLVYQEHLGEGVQFDLSLWQHFNKVLLKLVIRGSRLDVWEADSVILTGGLRFAGLVHHWEYAGGCNRVTLTVPLYNTPLQNMQFAWKYTIPHRKHFFFALACQWINIALNIVLPILSARLIVAYTESALRQVILTAVMLLGIQFLNNVSLFICNTQYNHVYTRVLSDLEGDLAKSALQIRNSCMEQKGAGLFIQRLTVDTTTLATGFNTIADQISTMFKYIGVLIALLLVSPPVFLVAFLLLAAQIAAEMIRTRRMMGDDRIYRKANERFSGFISEMVHGASDIKVLNSEEAFRTEIQKRINHANDSYMHMLFRSWKYKLVRWGIGDFGKTIYVCLLGLLIAYQGMTPAIAIVLYNYYSELGGAAVMLVGQTLEFIKSFNLSVERICALLNSPEFPKETFGTVSLGKMRGEISFDHVSFRYESADFRRPSRLVIRDMSFTIPAGSVVALVGKSGCGKSTVFRLIAKLLEASAGTVRLDGRDILTLDRKSIRDNLTVVSQHPYLFHMSIRENLRLVKPDMTEEEMKKACALACMDEEIERMPEGYDTLIGEGGVNLSGGQCQRLAIARSLLKDCRVLLFDEATSALDNITQARVQSALENIRGNRTIVMIAHRLSTVINADCIYFMEDGRILDQGTHQELISRCENYRALYEAEANLDRAFSNQNEEGKML